jgi:hypothetical protein
VAQQQSGSNNLLDDQHLEIQKKEEQILNPNSKLYK